LSLQIGQIDAPDGLGSEWSSLAESSGNIFATPEWLKLWWEHFGDGQEFRMHTVRQDGRVVALLPLVLWRTSRPRVLRFAGHGPSDQMGPVCAPEDLPLAAAALEQVLSDGGWDVLLAERLATGDVLPASLRPRELLREGSPLLPVEGRSWDDYLATKSSNFRQQARRRERKLAKERELTFRLADNPDRLDADLEVLFQLHDERWSGESGALREQRAAFHRDFARVALERGWLRLWLLELEGRPAAAVYGLRFAGRELYYQAGRDPDLDRAAVGFVLLVHSVRETFNDGLEAYDFLRGGEDYKDRFTDDETVVETWAAGRGALGRATVAVAPRMRSLLASRLR
jgi:CelD/BcsL family acetyltransferase involved in cellulose biosynthesis